MSGVLTAEGLRLMVESILERDLRLKLYANDFSPIGQEVAESFKEVSGFGYKEGKLELASLLPTPDGIGALFVPVTFQFDGSFGRIYGSYAVDQASGKVIWADKLPEVFKAVNRGDSLTIEPQFALLKEVI